MKTPTNVIVAVGVSAAYIRRWTGDVCSRGAATMGTEEGGELPPWPLIPLRTPQRNPAERKEAAEPRNQSKSGPATLTGTGLISIC